MSTIADEEADCPLSLIKWYSILKADSLSFDKGRIFKPVWFAFVRPLASNYSRLLPYKFNLIYIVSKSYKTLSYIEIQHHNFCMFWKFLLINSWEETFIHTSKITLHRSHFYFIFSLWRKIWPMLEHGIVYITLLLLEELVTIKCIILRLSNI